METLHLTLKKAPFGLMVKGAKRFEYRKPGKWIASRLVGKDYKFVKFTNGYGADKPWFIARYLGYTVCKKGQLVTYAGGFNVHVSVGDYIIQLGAVTSYGNLPNEEKRFTANKLRNKRVNYVFVDDFD